jgi:hypothetical protein
VEGGQWTGITSFLSGYPFSPGLNNNSSLNADMSQAQQLGPLEAVTIDGPVLTRAGQSRVGLAVASQIRVCLSRRHAGDRANPRPSTQADLSVEPSG